MTPNFKNFYPEALQLKKVSSDGGGSKYKGSKTFEQLFESQKHLQPNQLQINLRSKTCKEILMPLKYNRDQASTSKFIFEERMSIPSENVTPLSLKGGMERPKFFRQRSNVRLNSKLIKESPKETQVRDLNIASLRIDEEERKFQDFVSAKLSNASPSMSQNNSRLESPYLANGRRLLSIRTKSKTYEKSSPGIIWYFSL
jgi:hypothetical protein